MGFLGDSFFDKEKENKKIIWILTGIIVFLLLIILFAFKAYINVAQNKTIFITVPQTMDSGKYIIGNTQSSPSVYKMWVKVWMEEIGNFSYKDVDKRIANIYPFLDPITAMDSKAKLQKFINFIKQNYISQRFVLNRIQFKRLPEGYVEVVAIGKVYRKIGLKKDPLSGLVYKYKFILYTKNGSIWIKSLDVQMAKDKKDFDFNAKKQLKNNHYVNFK